MLLRHKTSGKSFAVKWSTCFLIFGQGKVMCIYEPRGPPLAGAYPSFCSMRQVGGFLLPSGWDASHCQGTLALYVTLLYTWVGRDSMKVKYFAQGQNAVSQGGLELW